MSGSLCYRELAPHPALRPFVRAYWTLRGGEGDQDPEPVLPDGSSELVVHRARPFLRHAADRAAERQASRLFVGQLCGPVVLQADGAADVVAIRFRPHGAFALLGERQDRLSDEIPEADALGARWLTTAMCRAQEAPTPESALRHLELALLKRLEGRRPADSRVAALVDLIGQTDGDVRIDEAAAFAGLSRRQVERLFMEQVGIGPKLLARLVRFQSAAQRLTAEPRSALAAVSGDSGYFDQSHMVREFLSFAGASPLDFRKGLGRLTAWMIAR
jgi:AraC-like DNA-binding protein